MTKTPLNSNTITTKIPIIIIAVEVTIPACTKDNKITEGLGKARENLNARTDLDPEYKAQLLELLESIKTEREKYQATSKCCNAPCS